MFLFFSGAVVKTKDHQLTVFEMEGDGDCLFAAIVNQLYPQILLFSADFKKCIQELRATASDFLKQNKSKETVRQSLKATLKVLKSKYKQKREDSKIQAFLKDLKNGNVWGGDESIWALAQAENLKINVFVEASTKFTVEPEVPAKEVKEVQIVFRKSIQPGLLSKQNAYNHYDSVQEVFQNRYISKTDIIV